MAEKSKFTFKSLESKKLRKFNHAEYQSDKEKKYVKNGNDNLFPQHLIEMYNRSSVHAAATNAIVEGVIGQGLTANEDIYLERANKKGESWNDLFAKCALDFKLHGSFALEIVYSNDRTRFDAYHIDYSFIRSKEKDSRGHIPGYFISTKWDTKLRFNNNVYEDKDIEYLPTYDTNKKVEEPRQIYVHRDYRPGQEYYSLPDYVAALRIIELDTSIDDFHTNNINNGLAPSLSITTFTNGSDEQLREIQGQLESNFAGTNNAGKLVYMDVPDREMRPEITPINPATTDTYYTTINDLVMQKILTAHRITSPMLLGIKEAGQLGGRAELLDAHLLFLNLVILPYQQEMLKCFEGLMSFMYPDIVLGIDQKRLLEDGEQDEEVIVSDDTTTEEEAEVTNEQPELLA